MGTTVISSRIFPDPVMMMTITLREVEFLCQKTGENAEIIKSAILSAETIPDIQEIIEKKFPGEIIIDA